MANALVTPPPSESVYIEEETRVVSAVFALQGDTNRHEGTANGDIGPNSGISRGCAMRSQEHEGGEESQFGAMRSEVSAHD